MQNWRRLIIHQPALPARWLASLPTRQPVAYRSQNLIRRGLPQPHGRRSVGVLLTWAKTATPGRVGWRLAGSFDRERVRGVATHIFFESLKARDGVADGALAPDLGQVAPGALTERSQIFSKENEPTWWVCGCY